MARSRSALATPNETPALEEPPEAGRPPQRPAISRDNVRAISPRRRELKLAAAIAAGDLAAFDQLHGQYRSRVYAFALKRMGDPTEADDICQDVFIEVHRSIGSFEGRSSLLTWLFGITHHQVCRRMRRRRLESCSLDAPGVAEAPARAPSVDERVDASRRLSACHRLLEERTPATQQEIFRLRYAETLSIAEIAHRLGKSQQAVKISLFRSRHTLAAAMEEEGIAESA